MDRDGTWCGVSTRVSLDEQYDTGLAVGRPELLALTVAMQLVFSWMGAIEPGSTAQYEQNDVHARFMRLIASFLMEITATAEEHGGADVAERASKVLSYGHPLMKGQA